MKYLRLKMSNRPPKPKLNVPIGQFPGVALIHSPKDAEQSLIINFPKYGSVKLVNLSGETIVVLAE